MNKSTVNPVIRARAQLLANSLKVPFSAERLPAGNWDIYQSVPADFDLLPGFTFAVVYPN
jgi:hypothetical protein